QIIFAQVEVGKSQHTVLDLGAGDQVVFGQNRQIVGIPAAVGQNGGVPDRVAVSIHDLGIIDDTRNAIRVLNVLSRVQVVHRPLDAGGAVQLAAKDCGLAAFRICQGTVDGFLQLIQVCLG